MLDQTVIVTALISGRPLCDECLAWKSGLAPSALGETLTIVKGALKLHEAEGRCRVCGKTARVVSLLQAA